MNEHQHDDERDEQFRVEYSPDSPPVFTVRTTLLNGRLIIAERRETYTDLYGALNGMTTLGENLANRYVRESLSKITPDTFPAPPES